MKRRIRISGRFAGDDHDDSVPTDAGREPQEGGVSALVQSNQPTNDSIESVRGNEGDGIRCDKPCPITLTGKRCAPLRNIYEFRRLIDSDHQASRTNQLSDPERCVASPASKIENTHAALYAEPPQDVFGKVPHGDDPRSQLPHFKSGIIQLAVWSVACCYLHVERFHKLTHWFLIRIGGPVRLHSRNLV